MTLCRNSIVKDNEERSWAPGRFPSYRATSPTSPPKPITLSHRITYVPCRAPMVPCLLRYPRCSKSALQLSLFSLLKLHLASHSLASSYSRVTFSSVFLPKIYVSAQVCGAPLKHAQKTKPETLGSISKDTLMNGPDTEKYHSMFF